MSLFNQLPKDIQKKFNILCDNLNNLYEIHMAEWDEDMPNVQKLLWEGHVRRYVHSNYKVTTWDMDKLLVIGHFEGSSFTITTQAIEIAPDEYAISSEINYL